MLLALERGARLRRDLSDNWDLWQQFDKPVEQVREEVGCLPLEALGARAGAEA